MQRRAPQRTIEGKSGEGIDQRAKHFVAGFFDSHASLDLNPALGQLNHVGGHVGALRTIDRTQAFELKIGGLAAARHFCRWAGQLCRRLIDTVLPNLHGAKAGVHRVVQ